MNEISRFEKTKPAILRYSRALGHPQVSWLRSVDLWKHCEHLVLWQTLVLSARGQHHAAGSARSNAGEGHFRQTVRLQKWKTGVARKFGERSASSGVSYSSSDAVETYEVRPKRVLVFFKTGR
ncbi:hypothetical protein AVEN_266475-1 [Araneus ventricosus]|uniref:Uncharacterized protein n=1 Tax=Araneus ventricosus TaxID=182803 RepID=A0A4Y2DZ04_ARAVE|nr:hypothetical protein AVEN_266475-1 [Araneus ventricosus]